MDRPRIYIETTIPSAYFDERTAPAMVARRAATREWWADAEKRYELVTSLAVHEELAKGPSDRSARWIGLLAVLPALDITPDIEDIVSRYRAHKLMPPDDALHLALASFYRCDYLVTWDLRHLANANKFGHIQRVNMGMSLFVPRILAPSTLMGEQREQA